jgi:hypothetical protein
LALVAGIIIIFLMRPQAQASSSAPHMLLHSPSVPYRIQSSEAGAR